MNTYGDKGNIAVLKKRCEWRNIECQIKELNIGFKSRDLSECNLIFMGGAQDRQQKIVSSDLEEKTAILRKMIDNDIPGLFICGAYQFLGRYYKEADGTIIKGLGILDIYTENPGENKGRLIGNVIAECSLNGKKELIVGFENHGGRTFLGKNSLPLARVIKGYGNNGDDKTEGVVYRKSIGTYLHGPILPKNPLLADLLIKNALVKKYKEDINLNCLDDQIETMARKSIAERLGIKYN